MAGFSSLSIGARARRVGAALAVAGGIAAVALRLGDLRAEGDATRAQCALWREGPRIARFRGLLWPLGGGGARLLQAERLGPRGWLPLGDQVRVEGVSGEARWVRLWGRVSCAREYRNPAALSDRWPYSGPRIRIESLRLEAEGGAWRGRVRALWERALAPLRHHSPGFLAWVRAAWTGDGSALPRPLWEDYRHLGLVHVLVQSGQHIAGAGMTALLALRGLCALGARTGAVRLSRWALRIRRLLPFLVVTGLFVLSPGAVSLQRVAWGVGAYALLRLRGLYCPAPRVVLAVAAAALLWDPASAGRIGYVLSVTGTVGLLLLARGSGGWLRRYIRISLGLPLLLLPLTVAAFGRVPGASLPANLLWGGLWGAIWIPAAFVAPLLGALPGAWGPWLLGQVEAGWGAGVRAAAWLGAWAEGVDFLWFRPTWGEALAWQVALLWWVASRGSMRRT